MIHVPTRGRRAWLENFVWHYRINQSTEPAIVMMDTDDAHTYEGVDLPDNWTVDVCERTNMQERHNRAFAMHPNESVYVLMADDFEPQTPYWDQMLREDAKKKGVAWSDDLLEHRATAPWIAGDLARAIGFVAVPVCKHLYCDSFWQDLQEAAGGESGFRPDIVARHHSYINDETHQRRQDHNDHENYREFVMAGKFHALVPVMQSYLREHA